MPFINEARLTPMAQAGPVFEPAQPESVIGQPTIPGEIDPSRLIPLGQEPIPTTSFRNAANSVKDKSGIFAQGVIEGTKQDLRQIGSVYPVAETAANLITSSYGVPISGLAGLMALPFGLKNAGMAVDAAQRALVYQPQTQQGADLTRTVTAPIESLDRLGNFVGNKIEDPDLAAAIDTAVTGAPALLALRASGSKSSFKIDKQISQAVDKGIVKSARPSVAGKKFASQFKSYKVKAKNAVESIIKNKENLRLTDETGAVATGLPKNLSQFAEAIEQTKKLVFEEYDSLAKETGRVGVKIDLESIARELDSVSNNKILKDFSPETIQYANTRAEALTGRSFYTAIETQEAIQILNQSLESFYRDPTPARKGRAMVDSMIANKLRKSLDDAISRETGRQYQALKNEYGSLRTIERDVNRRSIVDARKNIRGLVDFSDMFSGSQVIGGILAREPISVATGVATRGIASYIKFLNDPNRIVKGMFGDVESLITQRNAMSSGFGAPGTAIRVGAPAQLGRQENQVQPPQAPTLNTGNPTINHRRSLINERMRDNQRL